MFQEKELNYPSIGQSWGIVGIAILTTVVFSPINLFLNDFLGKSASFLIYYLLSMGVVFGIAHLMRKSSTGVNKYDFSLSSLKIMALVSISIIAIQTGIVLPLANLLPMPDAFKQLFIELGNQKGILSFIAIVIAAPVLEELIFRGIILDGLLRRYSPVKSIIISSVLFGIVHLNPWQFIAAFLIGVFSGWVYYKTRKLTLSIIIHAVNNLVAFVGMHFSDAETSMDQTLIELYGGLTNMILIIVAAIIVSIVGVLLLRKDFNGLKVDDWQQTANNVAHIEGGTVNEIDIDK